MGSCANHYQRPNWRSPAREARRRLRISMPDSAAHDRSAELERLASLCRALETECGRLREQLSQCADENDALRDFGADMDRAV